jgi:hypothetical protein
MKRTLLIALLCAASAWADTPVVQALGQFTDFAIHGRYAISAPGGGYQGPVHILDLASGQVLAAPGVGSTLNRMAAAPAKDWVAVDVDPDIVVYRLSDGRKLAQMPARTSLGMAASPDGKLFALEGDKMITLYTPQLVKIRSWKTPGRADELQFLDKDTIGLGKWRWNTSGKKLPNGSELQRPRAGEHPRYRVEQQEASHMVQMGDQVLAEFAGAKNGAIGTDGKHAVLWNDALLRAYSLPSGKMVAEIKATKTERVTTTGDWLIAQDVHGTLIHNLRDGSTKQLESYRPFYPGSLVAPGRAIVTTTAAPEQPLVLAVDGSQGTVHPLAANLVAVEGSVSPNGTRMLALNPDARTYSLLNTDTGKALWTQPLPKKGWEEREKPWFCKASWSRDGSRFLATLESGQGVSWLADAGSGKLLSRQARAPWALGPAGHHLVRPAERGPRALEVSLDENKTRSLPAVSDYAYPSFSPGGEFLCLHASRGFNLLRGDKELLRKQFPEHVGAAAAAWSPDGRWAALASPSGGRNPNGNSHLVDTQKLQVQTLTEPDRISEFRFSPDGKWLVSGGYSMQFGGLWALNGDQWKLQRQLRPVPGDWEGYDAQFSTDSRTLVVNRRDRLQFYSVPALQLLGEVCVFAGGEWLATSPTGAYDGSEGGIRRLMLRGQKLLPASQRPHLRRPGLLGGWF